MVLYNQVKVIQHRRYEMRTCIITTDENKHEKTLNNVIIEVSEDVLYNKDELMKYIRICQRMGAEKIEIYM